ncbi:hypothetical protein DB43_EI00540 [Parachlamydia acanthamoebae]|nr:hypothetical protein DB43_EI00540 [Parachlamydia acanthamoebae]
MALSLPMSTTKKYLNQIRRLSQALIVSFALNIGLTALFVYWFVKERPPTPYCELKPADLRSEQPPLAMDKSNGELIRHFQKMSLQQLLTKLGNNQLVENGYTQRDLAVASLVTFHHFDLTKALLGLPQPMQQRTIVFDNAPGKKTGKIDVYPGLTDVHYQAIMRYALTEQWPMTSEGLFLLLQKAKGKHDPSLADAFYLTQEFLAVEMLFNRAEVVIQKKELLQILIEGNWSLLSTFLQQQKVSQDLSAARRQRFLLDYIQQHSSAAAQLILKTDGLFALKKLNDSHVLEILHLLKEKTPLAKQFALALLTSPRSDAVWELAARHLYEQAGEPIPEKYQHHAALSRFIPQKSIIQNEDEIKTKEPPVNPIPEKTVSTKEIPVAPPISVKYPSPPPHKEVAKRTKPIPQNRLYIVQEGDTLWKIAGRFKIDVETLKKHNRLKSDALKVGEPLRIPT